MQGRSYGIEGGAACREQRSDMRIGWTGRKPTSCLNSAERGSEKYRIGIAGWWCMINIMMIASSDPRTNGEASAKRPRGGEVHTLVGAATVSVVAIAIAILRPRSRAFARALIPSVTHHHQSSPVPETETIRNSFHAELSEIRDYSAV